MKFLRSLILVGALAACATPITQSPQQVVFNAKTSYAAALIIGNEYKALPVCAPNVILLCHDPVVLAQAQKADNVAFMALNTAEAAVRTPQIGANAIDKAVSAANMALAAFTSITSQLRTK